MLRLRSQGRCPIRVDCGRAAPLQRQARGLTAGAPIATAAARADCGRAGSRLPRRSAAMSPAGRQVYSSATGGVLDSNHGHQSGGMHAGQQVADLVDRVTVKCACSSTHLFQAWISAFSDASCTLSALFLRISSATWNFLAVQMLSQAQWWRSILNCRCTIIWLRLPPDEEPRVVVRDRNHYLSPNVSA